MFKNCFSFNGRIRRLEYGISSIIYTVLYYTWWLASDTYTDSERNVNPLYYILFIILLIPLLWFMIAQSTKRCHDIGNSGWWQVLPFYGFLLLFSNGDIGDNEYGENPKGLNDADKNDPFETVPTED